MKYLLLSLSALIAISSSAQKTSIKEKALQEIRSLGIHGYELLGKTEIEIMKKGRPDSIIGGEKWEMESFSNKKEGKDVIEKVIIVGTGAGSLMITLSGTTKFAHSLLYFAHKKAKLSKQDIIDIFSDVCSFDSKGNCIITNSSGQNIRVSAGEAMVFIVAWDLVKGDMKFVE